MIRIAVVEDNEKDFENITQQIERYKNENEENLQVVYFSDGIHFVEEYDANYDVIFMDINMQHMDGVTASRKLRERDRNVSLVFVSSMAQFAIQGYEVDAIDFILKPIDYVQFQRVMEKVKKKQLQCTEDMVVLRVKDKAVKVLIKDIKYIESQKHYLLLHTVKEELQIRGNLSEWETQLTDTNFFRCNNSFLLNLEYVQEIKKNNVIVDGEELPISRNRKKEFLEAFTNYLGD